MSSSNHIKNVAIVGASGRSGSFIAKELLKTGKHTVTALTRPDSKSELPSGLKVVKVNYNDHDSLVDALKGHDALVITMSATAPKDSQSKLIQAAGHAGVPWILPNDWAPDTSNEGLVKDVSLFAAHAQTREEIAKLGKSSYMSVCTGFWYEWSLAIAPAFGFDLKGRKVTFFDEGETKISTSTWPQIGRAVAGLLSMPIKPEDGDEEHCLERFRDKMVYVNSFTVNQKDMFASVLRVTGTKESDWEVTKEPIHERYQAGLEGMKKGEHAAFAKWMYGRVFFPDGNGDFESSKGTVNNLLDLPTDDIDEATKVAITRADINPWA